MRGQRQPLGGMLRRPRTPISSFSGLLQAQIWASGARLVPSWATTTSRQRRELKAPT